MVLSRIPLAGWESRGISSAPRCSRFERFGFLHGTYPVRRWRSDQLVEGRGWRIPRARFEAAGSGPINSPAWSSSRLSTCRWNSILAAILTIRCVSARMKPAGEDGAGSGGTAWRRKARTGRDGLGNKRPIRLSRTGTRGAAVLVAASVSKALHLLTLFTRERPEWSLAELVDATGLNRASVYRILRTLEHDCFLAVDPETGRYYLGPAMYPVAYLTQAHSELIRLAHPHLESLARTTGETTALGVEVGGWVVVVDHVLTSHASKPDLPMGMALNDLSNSHAKLFLAFKNDAQRQRRITAGWPRLTKNTVDDPETLVRQLDQIRREGVAYDLEEHRLGIPACPCRSAISWGNFGPRWPSSYRRRG